MRKHLRKTKTALNQLYIAASWISFSRIVIEIDKTRTSQAHDNDTSNLRWRTYSNENERNEDVTAAAVNFNWNKKRCLKNAGTALTHHGELKDLIMIVEELINHCERATDARNRIYKVYFDSQTSLKMIHVMSSMFDQKRLQRIQMTMNKIRSHDIHLKLHWIFGHANIEGNEMTDKMTEKAHNFALSPPERFHHEVTTRVSLIRVSSRKIWNKRWKEETKEAQYRKLISRVNRRHLNIHAERPKTYNALIIQLRTSKIKFNKFLHERRVFSVLTAHCLCDDEHMIVKHVLFFCPNWKKKKKKMLQRAKITNIKRLLNERKATTVAVRMILTIDLLN